MCRWAQVAEKLAERGWLPDLIMSSDSTRTQQTLETMSATVAAFGAADAHFRGSLYTFAALDGQLRAHLQVPRTLLSVARFIRHLNLSLTLPGGTHLVNFGALPTYETQS